MLTNGGLLKDTMTALEVLGVDYGELHRFSRCPPPRLPLKRAQGTDSDAERARFYRRLYSAILLFVLIQEVPLTKVASYAFLFPTVLL